MSISRLLTITVITAIVTFVMIVAGFPLWMALVLAAISVIANFSILMAKSRND